MGADDTYDGIPVPELPITDVDVPDPVHLRRSLRYQHAEDIDPEAAVEAASDVRALIARDRRSATGEAIRMVGYSATADRVLVVVLIPDAHPPDGWWHVATAWPAGRRERGLYAGHSGEYEEGEL